MALRTALVYNYEDDNFTWMDASAILDDLSLSSAVCIAYQFEPGFQTRWSDLQLAQTLWSELQTAGTKWSDFYKHGEEEDMYYLTADGIWKAEQVIDTSGAKDYYVERTQLDFSDVIGGTSNVVNHLSQVYFHMESPIDRDVMQPNTALFTTGWSNSMMDEPEWGSGTRINIQKMDVGGSVKWDTRSSGRCAPSSTPEASRS